MKDIFVSHAKDDKKTARQLVTKLESEQELLCWIAPRDSNSSLNTEEVEKQALEDVKVLVLILSEKTLNSKEVIRQIKLAVENEVPIIPMKISQIPENLGTAYMLHQLEWVDAHADGFDAAYEILLEIYAEYTNGELPVKKIKNLKIKADSKPMSQTSKILLGAAAVFLLVFAIYFINSSKEDKSQKSLPKSLNKTENQNVTTDNSVIPSSTKNLNIGVYKAPEDAPEIAGTWRIIDYRDSRRMTPEERQLTEQNVALLKKNAIVIFRADGSFMRAGFTPKPQNGKWVFDERKLEVSLIPDGTNRAEKISLLQKPDSIMTIVVNEQAAKAGGGFEQVTTQITFKKQ